MPNINTSGPPITNVNNLKLFGMGENEEVGWISSNSLVPVAYELGDDPDLVVSQKLLTDSIADMEQSNDAAVVEATHQAGLAGDSAVIATEQAERVVAEFRTFVVSSGYQFAGDYATGMEITQYNQIIRDENGEFWRVSGQVDLPYVTTGAGIPEDDALVPVGDAVLRQDLANSGMGAAMVARGVVAVDSIADLLALPAGQRKEGLRYLVKGYHAGSDIGGGEFYWDATSDEVDNGGTVFGDAAQGRWKRNKGYTDAFMFGAIPGGAVSATDALMRAAEYTSSRGETLYLRRGQYLLDGPAIDLENFRIIGESGAEIVGDISTIFCRLRSGLHIEGLTFSGIRSVFYNIGIETQENLADITITNNTIKNCMRIGRHSYKGGVISYIDRLTITANKAFGCGNGVAIVALVTDALIESNVLLDTGFDLSGGAAIRGITIGIDLSSADPTVLNHGGSGVVRGNTVRRFGSYDKDIMTHGILLFGNFFRVSHNHVEEAIGSSDDKIFPNLHGIYLKGSGNVVSSNTLLNAANSGGAICIKPLWDAPALIINYSHVNNIIEGNNIEFKEDYYPEYRLIAIRSTGRGYASVIGNRAHGCRGQAFTVAGDNSLVSNNNLTDFKGHSGHALSTPITLVGCLRAVVSGNAIECRQVENITNAIHIFFSASAEGLDAPLSLNIQGNMISGFGTGASVTLTAFLVQLGELPGTAFKGSGLIRLDSNTISTDANITGRMYNLSGAANPVATFMSTGNVVNAIGNSEVSILGISANTVIQENNVGVTST